ncbi:MAG: NAD(P)-binding protein [Desulfobulbaceae bacterium]|nr:MAG: NAD(P)-binding protein [Desulfobulbaceae bacterium]
MAVQSDATKKSVAVIGGGVAGIVAAHRLQGTHAVSLFDDGDYLGGHTHTIVLPDGPDAGTPVDTGFIVFNEATYPRFIAFLDELGVDSRPTEMSFSCCNAVTGLVYAGNNLNGLFAQRGNLLRPSFYRFLMEITRFCRQGKADVAAGNDLGSLAEYIARHRFHPFMVDNYLKPMAAAIWSTPAAEVIAFPALSFLRFFRNHGLLDLWNRPAWRTVAGGSHRYVEAFSRRFAGTVCLKQPIHRLHRDSDGVVLEFFDGSRQHFDLAVVATHADQALGLLAEPTALERRLLGPWRYEKNDTVLHTDLTVLPRERHAWACWNFRLEGDIDEPRPAYVTYAMNLLQGFAASRQYLVTLNRPGEYPQAEVVARMVYHHPTYNAASMATQPELPALNRDGRAVFCGSYFGYGFHEDAVRAGEEAAAALLRRVP